MKNRRTEIILWALALGLNILAVVVDLYQGISRADIFNSVCAGLVILLWGAAILKGKRDEP